MSFGENSKFKFAETIGMLNKIRKVLIFFLLALLISGCAQQSQSMEEGNEVKSYRQISQEEAMLMMGRNDGHVIVDVRRQDEYDTGHIPGAILIPNESIGAEYMAALREKFPEYFDLDTFKGLEVYAWQMARDSYSFGVMMGTNRNKTLEEMMRLKGATAVEMRAILSTYDIPKENIIVIPWQNPISSYIGEYWIQEKNEDSASVAKRREEYIESLRKMLFGDEQ